MKVVSMYKELPRFPNRDNILSLLKDLDQQVNKLHKSQLQLVANTLIAKASHKGDINPKEKTFLTKMCSQIVSDIRLR